MSLTCFTPISDTVSLCWKNITYSIYSKHLDATQDRILDNVSGYVTANNVLCILGESGCGKTSLLEILCGVRKQSSGSIYYNGKLENNATRIKNKNCFSYIAQDIILPGSLTISECLRYTAELRNMKKNGIGNYNIISEIISVLNLNKCCNTIIESISFGEKKRALFGIEILSQPSLLFLDEILSGLDSINAYNIFSILNDLKDLGHCIIISIHQPSLKLFQMMKDFNFSIQLLHNGENMYFGAAQKFVNYFNSIHIQLSRNNTNPIDFLFDIIINKKKKSDYIINSFSFESADHEELGMRMELQSETHEINNINYNIRIRNVSIFDEVIILCKRNFRNDLRSIFCYWTRLLMYVILSIICGLLFYDICRSQNSMHNRIGYLLYVVNFLSLMSLTSMQGFMKTRQLYIQENLNNHYSPFSYVCANFVCSIPWNITSSILVTTILINLVQSKVTTNIIENNKCYVFVYFLNCFLLSMVTESIAITTTTLSTHYMIVFAMIGGSIGIFVMFAGALILYADIPLYFMWIYYISYFNYSFKIFMYNDFKNELQNNILTNNIVMNGNDILQIYDMDNVNILQCFLILFIMLFVYRIAFYFSLKYIVTW